MEEKYTEKKLFTPGPLCCSMQVKKAMLVDLGSRDQQFIDCVADIRQLLLKVADVSSEDYVAVPMQGSGTFSVEAVLQTTMPKERGKLLILSNGAYGRRMRQMCQVANLEFECHEFPEDQKIDLMKVEDLLTRGVTYCSVAVVHCETSSGIINSAEEIGMLVKKHQPESCYIVDAMSSFGAVAIDMVKGGVDYLVSSANKCLEGVPGFAFVICRIKHLITCAGNCRVLSLDLVDQYNNLEKTKQFRFTPPTHTMLAFRKALQVYFQDGGLQGRADRYRANCSILKTGMNKLGFQELLPNNPDGFIITSFHMPKHARFNFELFYKSLSQKGQVIYPGKVTEADCFRVGNIGYLFPEDIRLFLLVLEVVMAEMGLPVPLK